MIRCLEIGEFPLAYELGTRFFEEGKVVGKIKKDVFISTWTALFSQKIGIIFGLFKDDILLGMIGGIVFPDPNDGCLVANEMFWYVDKQHRGTGGIKLYKKFEEWAISAKAKRFIMVYLINLMPDKLKQFYEKQGFSPLEISYVKEL